MCLEIYGIIGQFFKNYVNKIILKKITIKLKEKKS